MSHTHITKSKGFSLETTQANQTEVIPHTHTHKRTGTFTISPYTKIYRLANKAKTYFSCCKDTHTHNKVKRL
jgi:hypothetical protein